MVLHILNRVYGLNGNGWSLQLDFNTIMQKYCYIELENMLLGFNNVINSKDWMISDKCKY